eukprot:Skav200682  [mRNA]  locus=scaffold1446:200196:205108:+ [translate_table: standard]
MSIDLTTQIGRVELAMEPEPKRGRFAASASAVPDEMKVTPTPSEEAQKMQRRWKRHLLEIVRAAQLRREDLMFVLSEVPPERVMGLIKDSFVLVKTAENQVALAEVMGAPEPMQNPKELEARERFLVKLSRAYLRS